MNLQVRSSSGTYDINFCSLVEVQTELKASANAVVTDDNLAAAYSKLVRSVDRLVVVAPGESSKNGVTYLKVLESLASQGLTRGARLAAVGGGVVGDLAGFAAATYMRGIKLSMIPTSLLAMVDSSIGGKVGIDLPQGKNLVGAFYPPQQVLICTEFLRTLPEAHFWNGCAEVLKTALIADATLVGRLLSTPLTPNSPDLEEVIRACVAHKARIVEEDEHETTGLRATLNFGHTVGHALEKELHYEGILHGEAIAIGMVAETLIGEYLGLTPIGTADQVKRLLHHHELPVVAPEGIDAQNLVQAMKLDKKSTATGIGMSLLTGVGTCKLVQNVSESEILRGCHEIGFA